MTVTPAIGWVSSGFGPRNTGIPGASTYHLGTDIVAPLGRKVVSPLPGVVYVSAYNSARGYYVIVRHSSRWYSWHQHLHRRDVYAGQVVAEGQQIGTMGTTGTSSGVHLHTEIRDNGVAIDPVPWYRARGVTLGVGQLVLGDVAMSAADVWNYRDATTNPVTNEQNTTGQALQIAEHYSFRGWDLGINNRAQLATLTSMVQALASSVSSGLDINPDELALDTAAALAPLLLEDIVGAIVAQGVLSAEDAEEIVKQGLKDVINSLEISVRDDV